MITERVKLRDDELVQHIAVLGASGEGKTTLFESILLQHIKRGGGAIFIDAKLDYETLKNLVTACTRVGRLDDLKVVNIDDPSLSHSYNPLLQGDVDEIASRAMLVFPDASTNPTAEHFREMHLYSLTAVIAAIKECKLAFNFMDLSIIFSNPVALEYLHNITPPSPAKRNLALFIEQLRDSKGNIRLHDLRWLGSGGLAGTFFVYGQGNLGEVTGSYTPEINLYDVIMKNQICYIMLPTLGKGDIAKNLARLIIADIRSAVYHIQKSKIKPVVPFLLLMDEFNRYASLSGTDVLFEQARSAKVCCIPAFQTVKKEFSALFQTVLGNTLTKIFFRIGDYESAEIASKTIGQEVKRFESQSQGIRWDPFEPIQWIRRQKTSGKSEQYDYTIRPEMLMSLERGEAILLNRNNVYRVRTPMVRFDNIEDIRIIHNNTAWRRGLNLISRFDPKIE